MATTYADTQTQVQPIGQGMGDKNALQILMSAIGGNQDQTKSAPAKKAATTPQDPQSMASSLTGTIPDDHAALLRKVLTIGTAQQMSQMMAQGVTAQELAPRVDNMVKAISSVGTTTPPMSMMPKDITPAATDATASSSTPPPMSMIGQSTPSTDTPSSIATPEKQPGNITQQFMQDNSPQRITNQGVNDTLHMRNAPNFWSTGGYDEKGNPFDTGAGIKLLTLLAGGGWQSSAEGTSKLAAASSNLLDTLTKKAGLAAGAPSAGVALTKSQTKAELATAQSQRAEAGLKKKVGRFLDKGAQIYNLNSETGKPTDVSDPAGIRIMMTPTLNGPAYVALDKNADLDSHLSKLNAMYRGGANARNIFQKFLGFNNDVMQKSLEGMNAPLAKMEERISGKKATTGTASKVGKYELVK